MSQPKRVSQSPSLVAVPSGSELADDAALAEDRTAPLVVDCLEAEHPTLMGRVKVRWRHDGRSHERWLPTLRGLSVREGDRLLVTRASNWKEAIVIGVIDGFARRPPPPEHPAAEVRLRPDETVSVRAADGEPLFELRGGEHGPEIHFAQPDVELCVDGALRIAANTLTLTAREGEARIEASDDVVVRGDNIQLN